MTKPNHSEKTVALRLKQVSQLRRVCLSLGKAGSISRSASGQEREDQGDPITGKLNSLLSE